MSDTVKVQGPIHVQPDGPARVAFELMEKIGDAEYKHGESRDKNYWIKLYCQCYQATHGISAESILKAK